MGKMLNNQQTAERLESLKAGIIGASCLAFTFMITSLINQVIFKYLETYTTYDVKLSFHWLLSLAIASFSGFLFGVTYRYIIRSDTNLQLKAGGILAFGLVRGLTQVDTGLNTGNFLPLAVLAMESILYFAVTGFFLDKAISLGWVKRFS
jgi:hypothetical protein